MTTFPNPQQTVGVRLSPYQEVKSYQMPQHLISMALDKELTRAGVMDVLFSPESVTLKERDTFVTRMKENAGGGAFASALIDIATNPFVWLMFMTTPGAAGALGRMGKGLFSAVKKQYAPFVMKNAPFLQAIGMSTPMQAFHSTAIIPALMQVTKGIQLMDREMSRRVVPHLRKLLDDHGLHQLNPDLIPDPVLRAKATKINDAIYAKLAGWDQDWVEFKTKVKRLKDSDTGDIIGIEATPREIHHARKVNVDLDRVLEQLGATKLANALQKSLSERWARVFANDAVYDATGRFVLDEDKVLRVYRGLRTNKVTSGKGALDAGAAGAEQVGALMGPEVAEAVRMEVIGEAEFLKALRNVAGGKNGEFLNKFYVPENMVDMVGGISRDPRALQALRSSRTFMTTGAAIPRRFSQTPHDPEDLVRVVESLGGERVATPALISQISEMRRVVGEARTTPIHVFKINAFESMKRYFRDTGETHALYVQKLDDSPGTIVARQEWNPLMDPQRKLILDEQRARFEQSKQWGGTSMADVLYEQHFAMQSTHSQRALSDIVLPRLLERAEHRSLPHIASYAALLTGKQGLAAFLETGAGKALRDSGAWGKKWHDKMKFMADPNVPMGAGRTISAKMARYLYVTHLGMNIPSTVLNLTQPFLLAATWLGARNVIKAYKSAFKELGGYVAERSRMGFRRLTDIEQSDMLIKHFKHMGRATDGENLLTIGRDAFDTLDSVTYRQSGLARAGRKESIVLDTPMKLFEKAEWLNRSVTAHAVEEAYKAAGRFPKAGDVLAKGRMNNDIFRMVGETQFGGNVLNTPLLMLGGGPFGQIFDNPLMRQFLSFPIRSFTGLFGVGPKQIAGRTFMGMKVTGPWGNLGVDVIRGMGISAVIYEVGKNFFGADLSRGLFAQSSLDLFGGERFLEEGNKWIPIPPIINIPADFIRAFATQDMEVMRQVLPRIIAPGGIALSRAIGILPDLSGGFLGDLPHLLQKTYVDYSMRQPDGSVPRFSADGRLIDMRHGGEIILRGLGADMGRFQNAQEIDNYMVQQRENIVQARRDVMRLLLSNETQKAESIRRQFRKRHGFPLTVTKQQFTEAMRMRSTPRAERILERLPPDARPMFQQLAAISGVPQRSALPMEAIAEISTARQRDALRQVQTVHLDPATLLKMRQLAEEAAQIERAGRSFVGFSAAR